MQPPSSSTTVVEGELNLADKKLSSAPVDPEELARASERKALVEQGKTLQAQQLYADASKKADEAIIQLATLRTERDEALRERDRARDAEKAAVKKALDDAELAGKEFAKRWDDREKDFAQQKKDLEDGIARQTQFYLTMGCYGLAVICVIIAGLLAYFSFQSGPVGIATLGKRIGLPSLFAMIFFALGRLTSQSWFWWACGIVSAVAVLSFVAAYVIDARKTKKVSEEKSKVQQVGDDLITAVSDIRGVLKNPPVEVVRKIMEAKTVEEATAVVQSAVKSLIDGILSEYVTESDGTAAYVDSRRRSLGLINSRS